MPGFRPLSRPLLAALALLVGLGGGVLPSAQAAPPTPGQLQALEAALNSDTPGALGAVVTAGAGLDPVALERRRLRLRDAFRDLRWQVSPASALRDGRPTVTLRVTGRHEQAGTSFLLEAEQRLVLDSDGQRIQGQTVVQERSLLSSGTKVPAVSVLIPDAVLTGQRYDLDVVFDEPLDGALVAGGVVPVTPEQVDAQETPEMQLGALGGGGLFKTVQAPLKPGFQTWAVLLVHPDGIVSASKRVRVVADRQALNP